MLKVFYIALMIFRSVAFIKVFYMLAGKMRALIAKPHESSSEQFAVYMSAVFSARNTAFTVCSVKAFAFYVIFLGKIMNA